MDVSTQSARLPELLRAVAAVAPVVRQVLRHEVHLARSLQLQQLRLAHHLVHRERAVLAAHERDGAERTSVIASLAHLEVADVPQVADEEPLAGVHPKGLAEEPPLLELWQEPVYLGGAQEQVHLGQSLEQLFLVPLHHAADPDDRTAGAALLESARLHQGVDGLPLRGVDEAARVHHDHLGVAEVVGVVRAVRGELGEVALAVDRVLVAAEGDEADLHDAPGSTRCVGS
jgi:hypothetical protein